MPRIFVGLAVSLFVFGCPGWTTFASAQSEEAEDVKKTKKEKSTDHSFKRQSSLLPSADLKEGTTNARWKKIIDSSPHSIVYERPLAPGEHVFVGVQRKAEDASLRPVVGWRVPEKLEQGTAWLHFSIVPPPFDDPTSKRPDNQVRFYLYNLIRKKNLIRPHGIEWTWIPADNPGEKLQFFTPRINHVPVQVSGTRLYTVPFAKRDERTYSLVVAITTNTKQLKTILNVRKSADFNWNDWFQPVE